MAHSTRQGSTSKQTLGQQKYFLLYLTLFVVLTSFCYGLVQGFRQTASASKPIVETPLFSSFGDSGNSLLPEGVKVLSLGNDTKIDNKKITLVNFFVNGEVPEFARLQQQLWHQRGLQPINRVSAKRAVSVAIDRNSAKRYSLVVWRVPPIARKISEGYSLQGILAISGLGESTAASVSSVPGVPLRPGGSCGTVFSSNEGNGRSYTANYSNPGTVRENVQFYQNELLSSGWQYREGIAPSIAESGTPLRLLEFSNAREELTLLFSGVSGDGPSGTTLVTVVRAPKSRGTL